MNKPALEGGTPVRNKKDTLIFGQPDINEDDVNGVISVLRSGWVSTGPVTTLFETNFARYCGADYAVATNSCTAALHLALMVLDLSPGDEVITTDMTFCATINAIIHAGLKPVIVDCDRITGNIDVTQIEKKITNKTKVLLPVHLSGMPCNITALREIASSHNLILVSDSAHAIESLHGGKSMAELSDISCYSFYATKNICTAEGGMLLTNNVEYADKARQMSLHGMSKNASMRYSASGFNHYSIDMLGYKYNMTDIAAAMGVGQLKRISDNWAKRKSIWDKYTSAFDDLPIYYHRDIPKTIRHGYHLFTIQIDLESFNADRDFILNAIQHENVTVGVHYKAIHTHPYYREFGWNEEEFPNAQWMSDRTISLPLSPKVTDEDTDDVIEAVIKVLRYYEK